MDFTGLKFKNGTEVKANEVCLLMEKGSDDMVFLGKAIGNGMFRGHLDDGDDMVPAFMMMNTHYLLKEDHQ